MQYQTKDAHGLAHDPFKALVSPRPIGWISSVSRDGLHNLAPYSFFNAVCAQPPMVMFSSSTYKDSVRNVDETGEFVCNLVSRDLLAAMNASSQPVARDIDEFDLAGLGKVASSLVRPPRVAGVKAALECRHISTQHLKGIDGQDTHSYLVIGQVVSVYIDDGVLRDGKVDMAALQLASRLGYMDYACVDEVFELDRPK
ncbi:flavin reductase family protein [Polycladidibacter hongkongensis]|uniref:flavin reductase family protein n=1 Tax=Polycladidibacter hongkongensis TaxID=1647556 RepID=UPI00082BD6FA|nr:flavin reductase family protein [Pseudovibrio hongkongensis]